ncbi:uncharacterized protein G2W53_018556 [Senna tora]|uniref:Uncharacterized protein n=1 Tax=Senna tora TaxID=362788 RepID=A0A834WLF8_9FABA|nr:uncharacterized protein G2W53_018556 [Senna tora]
MAKAMTWYATWHGLRHYKRRRPCI